LAKTFANMRRARLKLNLEKCVFGICRCFRPATYYEEYPK
jgi:hypothetical protein